MDKYIIYEIIGKGSYGIVYRAYDTINDRYIAIKEINKSKIANKQRLDDEINILKYLEKSECNNIVSKYYDTFSDDENVFIIMEYIEGIVLSKYILLSDGGKINIKVLLSIYYELAKGLECIHSKGIAHRDIKLDNIIIIEDGSIKYIDFGLSCIQNCIEDNCENLCGSRAGQVGTPLYFPPEWKILNVKNISRIQLAQKGDVWSLGIVMYELANKKRYPGPFRYSKYGSNYGDPTIDNLIKFILNPDPHSRLTASELKSLISNIIKETIFI